MTSTAAARQPTALAVAAGERQLWEGDRVSVNLAGRCTGLSSLPRFDGLARSVAEVCSGREATLLASGHYGDERFLWRRMDFGGGVSGWIVDGPSSGSDPASVVLVSRGAGPLDGPYIPTGTAVVLYPPTPGCLTIRSFPSNHADYAQAVGQVCEVTAAKTAADIRYRDEGLYWRRVEISGASGPILGWVTDGAIAGPQPRSVYDPAKEQRPTPTPTAAPATPTSTPPPPSTVRPNTGEAPIVKQLSARVGGYIDMDGRYGLEFQYELNRPSDGRWRLFVGSFNYCRDAAGAKLGASDGVGAIASQFSPVLPHAGLALDGQAGSAQGEFGAAFLVPSPAVPPPLPIRCAGIRVSIAHFPKILFDSPAIRLTPAMADRLETFELAGETSSWGGGHFGGRVGLVECTACTGGW